MACLAAVPGDGANECWGGGRLDGGQLIARQIAAAAKWQINGLDPSGNKINGGSNGGGGARTAAAGRLTDGMGCCWDDWTMGERWRRPDRLAGANLTGR